MSNLIHFKGEIVHFFLKNEALRSESVNTLKEQTIILDSCKDPVKLSTFETQRMLYRGPSMNCQ